MPIIQFKKGTMHKRVEWLIEDTIPMRHATIVSGEPNVGKSRLWTQIAWHLATGVPFWWKKIPPKVVLLVTERTQEAVWEQCLSISHDFEDVPNLFILSIGDMTPQENREMLQDPIGFIENKATGIKPHIIIFDTVVQVLIRAGATPKTNDYGEGALNMRNLQQFFHRMNCAGICVHHMRKQTINDSQIRVQDRSLGSQAVVGGTIGGWYIELLTAEDLLPTAEYIYLRVRVGNHLRKSQPPVYLKIANGESIFEVCDEQEAIGASLTTPDGKLVTAPLQKAIMEAAATGASRTEIVKTIADRFKVDTHNVQKAIKKLIEKGELEQVINDQSGEKTVRLPQAQVQ